MTANNRLSKETYTSAKELKKSAKEPYIFAKKLKSILFLLLPPSSRNMTANNRMSKETYTSTKELQRIRKRALYIRTKR